MSAAASRTILIGLVLAYAMLPGMGHSQTGMPQQTADLVFAAGRTTSTSPDDYIQIELSQLGPRGDLIAHVREQTLEILEANNTCSGWFEEAEPDAAGEWGGRHIQRPR